MLQEMVLANRPELNQTMELAVTSEVVENSVALGIRWLTMAQRGEAWNHPVPPRQARMLGDFGRMLIGDSIALANKLGLSFNPGLRTRAQLVLNS